MTGRAPVTSDLPGPRSFDEFRATRYFPTLDGLRAVSILLVVGLHTRDPMWAALHGTVGVTVFFVLSGWLITTLLIREEAERGHAALSRFFARRAFRLLPVYFTVLAVFIVLIVGFGLPWGRDAFIGSLPYYLTYQNDFAPTSLFGHTWSLAIEEKFYLVWPLLAFAAARAKRFRGAILVVLLLLSLAAEHIPGAMYFATYTPLVLGCLLAVLMHDRVAFGWIARLAQAPITVLLVVAAGAVAALDPAWQGHVHTLFAVLVALALPGFVLGSSWLTRLFRLRPLIYVGTRSYSLYLVHPLVIAALSGLLPSGSTSKSHEILHLVAVLAVSLAAAELLYRFVEQPGIRFGRRVAMRAGRRVAATSPEPAFEQATLEQAAFE